jgi:hypothetical protein
VPREEIQKTNPNGIGNRLPVEGIPTGSGALDVRNCLDRREIRTHEHGIQTEKRALACGSFGMLLGVFAWLGLENATYGTPYIGVVLFVACGFIAPLFGIAACIIALCDLFDLSMRPTWAGLGWAVAGGVSGLMAIILFCATWIDLIGHAG